MKANELRINCYYKGGIEFPKGSLEAKIGFDEDRTFKITEHEMGIIFTPFTKGLELWKFIEPIPLTEEWLLNFGMKIYTDSIPYNYRWNPKSKDFRIQYAEFGDGSKGFQALYLHGKYWRRLRFVHELQNLYFCLTGEELEIKQ